MEKFELRKWRRGRYVPMRFASNRLGWARCKCDDCCGSSASSGDCGGGGVAVPVISVRGLKSAFLSGVEIRRFGEAQSERCVLTHAAHSLLIRLEMVLTSQFQPNGHALHPRDHGLRLLMRLWR